MANALLSFRGKGFLSACTGKKPASLLSGFRDKLKIVTLTN